MGTPKVPKTLPRGSYGQKSFPNNGCMCAQPLQSCQTLCNPRDCSPPGSSVCGIFQVRILEWINLPGGLPGPGTEPVSPAAPALQVNSLLTEPPDLNYLKSIILAFPGLLHIHLSLSFCGRKCNSEVSWKLLFPL